MELNGESKNIVENMITYIRLARIIGENSFIMVKMIASITYYEKDLRGAMRAWMQIIQKQMKKWVLHLFRRSVKP